MGRKSKARKLAVISGTEAPIRHDHSNEGPHGRIARRKVTAAELAALIGEARHGTKQ